MNNQDLKEFYRRGHDNALDFPRGATLHQLIAECCRKYPDKVAVFCDDQELTYEQLDSAANRLANYLITRGVGPGDLVGLCCNRTIDVPVLLNGILRSGAGYVPLDPDYPLERLQYMVENAGIAHVLAHDSLRSITKDFETAKTIFFDSEHQHIQSQSDVAPDVILNAEHNHAYVIYTSGSTGKPKGVSVSHRCAVNLMYAFSQRPGFTAADRLLATTTLSFDISVIEMFMPLFAGGQIVIVDRATAKDHHRLVGVAEELNVTYMQATPSHWRMICDTEFEGGDQLKILAGGEKLPRDLIDPLLEIGGEVWNCYGPTECTVYSHVHRILSSQVPVLVGQSLANTTSYVVDEAGQLCGPGQEGELWIGGDCVADGYLHRDELTAEKFVELDGERVYRSGDLATINEEFEVEIIGRIDNQVKIRGYRIELEEIDAAMVAADEDVQRAAAVVNEDESGDVRLVGYVLPREGQTIDLLALKNEVAKTLPDYMVPAVFSVVEEFHYTPSGKTDRKAFPPPSTARPEIGIEYVAAQSDQEKQLAKIWREVLMLDEIGIDDNFFQLGGNSIKALKVVKSSNAALGTSVSNAEFFDNPTIGSFIQAAENQPHLATLKKVKSQRSNDSDDFAVVGMAVKLPGANNVAEFWQNLCDGKETIRFFSDEELDPTLPREWIESPNYVKARGVVEEADYLDARFFNMPPREAELVDPQQRVMLELSWTALEDAGCIPEKFDGKIGVWAGSYMTSYHTKNLLTNSDVMDQFSEFQLSANNEKDYIATRVAHRLNLNGPAVNVNTACSTSLVAIIQACMSLQAGFCDAAIAGGVSVYFPQNSGHLYQEGSIFSPDGHCRPFDADSAGTLFSDGAGAVVIKRLDDAIASNDHIHAVIKGFGINNDGGRKASFSAPSIEGQADAIAMAHANADVDADSISYVEAHGTATPIGDPIEVAALTRAFGATTDEKQFCGIGSVKSNVGHTVAAAGVTGFVKTVLALEHETIPATLHYQKPNPQIDFASTPFFVCDEKTQWPRGTQPRRAGVSSFGVGGTNAHIILEEAPVAEVDCNDFENQLLPLSAKTESALFQAKQNLADSLADSRWKLNDVAATLNQGRAYFAYRGFCVAESIDAAITQLNSGKVPNFVSRKAGNNRNAVFMFPGQGAQYVRMGQDLYQRIEVFQKSIDESFEILQPLLGQDLREVLFPAVGNEATAQAILKETRVTQPTLFAVGYAMAKTMMSFGVNPSALIGHSIGEFAAACLAGVFSLEDGLKFIAKRGELMQNLPGGTMMSVRLPGAQVEPLITGRMAIAAYNGPELCVVAGPGDEVGELQKQLEGRDVVCRYLHTSHAFHSPMMDSIVDPFARFVGQVELQTPQIPIFSTVAGGWMRDEEATDPNYWAEHLRQPVRFSDAISQLWNEDPSLVLVELGPRKTLSTLALQHAVDRKIQVAVPTMSDTIDDQAEWKSFLTAAGQLWTLGVEIDLMQLPADGRIVNLPTYPFERKQFFVKPGSVVKNEPLSSSTSESVSKPLNETFSEPTENIESPESDVSNPSTGNLNMNRLPKIIDNIKEVFEESSGFDLNEFEDETTFFEMGLDSLVLTQTATALKRNFDVEVTFRQLLEDTPNVVSLAEFLDEKLPADRFAVDAQPVDPAPVTSLNLENVPPENTVAADSLVADAPPKVATAAVNVVQTQISAGDATQAIINNQLHLMAAQLQLLGGNVQLATPVEDAKLPTSQVFTGPAPVDPEPIEKSPATPKPSEAPAKKAFGAAARVSLSGDELNDAQQAKLDEVIRETQDKMPASKAYAQEHRKYMADPRTVSGFRPNMKEMTFPIVVEKSKGVYLYDLDGNEFIDYTCGFGSNFLGHSTDAIVNAVGDQLPVDYSIGPQSPLAGEVARLFCELTGNERMAFSNTGSEAVLGCTRLARAYSGKQKIAMFTGDYHGILDEVIVRGNKSLKSFPAATGIPREHVDNTLILDYGSEESLQIIQDNLDDLAAVVVETVQSRRPEWQPREYLHKLRAITEDVDTALIFDEVITGFRIAPGGAQEHFGVRADLASYGKVVGGGLPIGVIGGRAEYMDGLDGGFWQYGDDSRPEAGMTYFAGTFVRHPLTLAAAKAILEFIQSQGQSMYDRLNSLSDNMASQLNAMFTELEAPMRLANFGSLFKVQFDQELPYSELIFAKLRLKGFFIWDHRPCLLNVQHQQEHVDAFVRAFREVIIDLQRAGFVPGKGYKKCAEFDPANPPSPEARIGKDRQGNPGWFINDATNPGQFIQQNQTI